MHSRVIPFIAQGMLVCKGILPFVLPEAKGCILAGLGMKPQIVLNSLADCCGPGHMLLAAKLIQCLNVVFRDIYYCAHGVII